MDWRSISRRAAALLLPLLLLAACARGPEGGSPASSDAVPQRIIALTPTLVETLFALGLGDRVVGIGDYAQWPPEALSKPRLGGLFNPNLERIVSLHPDLAVLLPSEQDLGIKLKPLGAEILVVRNETLDDIERSFHTIADRCGVSAAGDRLAAEFRAGVAPSPLPGSPLKVMISVGRQTGRLGDVTAAARGTFYDELLTRLGAVNVFADAPNRYPQVGAEEIVARRPDVILELWPDPIPPDKARAIVQDWAPLSDIPAVRDGRVAIISGDYALAPGPRAPKLYAEIRQILQGDAKR